MRAFEGESQSKRVLRFLRRNLTILPAAVVLVILVLVGVFGPALTPHDPIAGDLEDRYTPPWWVDGEYSSQTVVQRLDINNRRNEITLTAARVLDPKAGLGDVVRTEVEKGGSTEFLLGTDHLGRDILSRLVHGARISLIVMAVTILIGGVLGTVLGLVSGYFGGVVDEAIMRLVDVALAIPVILVALVLVASFGASFGLIFVILVGLLWVRYARQTRAEVLQLKQLDFVASAKVSGATHWRVLFRHLFPSVLNTVVVLATLQVGIVLSTEAALSFLGAGIPPPNPAWGSMVADGRGVIRTSWWVSAFPGAAITLTVVSTNLFGDWLRDKLDPKLRQLM
jgi:peptide/nickel transport system permease protein